MGLAESPDAVGEVFNIGASNEVTIYQLAEIVKARTGSSSEIIRIPYDKAYEAGFEDMRRRVPDISKIERLIGWKPTTNLETTIDQIIAYQKPRLSGGSM